MNLSRRTFVGGALAAAAGGSISCGGGSSPAFRISLAQYSLHQRIWKLDGADPLDPLEFPRVARSFGLDAVEYVSMLWREEFEKRGESYLHEMRKRADDEGVKGLLIMVDREGMLGDADQQARIQAVANHERWMEAAAILGCRSIRVDPKASGETRQEAREFLADGLDRLCRRAESYRMDVLVENEAGFGADADWLVSVMKAVNHPLLGTLPDFGNFWIDQDEGELYDPYEGVRKLMPWARAVSAKSFGFESPASSSVTRDTREGRELELDFARLMRIVVKAGYGGYVGIEYEGQAPEMEGIAETKLVLERLASEL